MSSANLERFVREVNNFSTSKFILYESKLSRLLSSLSSNQTVYDVIEKCLRGFDFEVEFKRSMNAAKVSLPGKHEKLIALVYCVLVEIDGKKIDFYKFLKTYFSSTEINLCFAKFIEEMIVPFKNAMLSICGESVTVTADDDEEEYEEEFEEVEMETKIPETPIGFFAIDMHTKLRNLAMSLPRCEMAMPIFDAMKWAIDNNNKALFQSLAYSLCFITGNKQFAKIAKQIYSANYNPKYR